MAIKPARTCTRRFCQRGVVLELKLATKRVEGIQELLGLIRMGTPSLERGAAWAMRSAVLSSEPLVPTRATVTPSKDPYLTSCSDMRAMPPPERSGITLVTSMLLVISMNSSRTIFLSVTIRAGVSQPADTLTPCRSETVPVMGLMLVIICTRMWATTVATG